MKIGFDARYVRTDNHDGISRFSSRLVEQLGLLVEGTEHSVLMLISDTAQRALLPDLPYALISSPTSAREPFVAKQVNKLDVDIVFSPMQTMGSYGRRYDLVLTVHDLIYYRHPKPPTQFAWPIRALWRLYHTAWWPQRWLLNRSDAVVAVSQTTKNLIAEHSLTSKPVYVVHNAADVEGSDHSTAAADARKKSVVYMGSFMPYKNVETLVQAVALLPEFELHLMSRISESDQSRLQGLAPKAHIIFHNGTTDEEYFEALGQCTALVTASRDEGFGIPLVEAMNVGTPVVVSDIEIFHEIGGRAARYVPCDDVEGIVNAIRQLEDPATWLAASQESRRQAARFSWARSAQELLDVLVNVGSTEAKR